MLSLMVCLVDSSATLLDIVSTVSVSALMESVWAARSLKEDDLITQLTFQTKHTNKDKPKSLSQSLH